MLPLKQGRGAMLVLILTLGYLIIASHANDLESRFDQWLGNFTAFDPEYQTFCKQVLTTRTGSTSQFEQDIFIFYNMFKYWPMNGKKGFYIDSGANHYKDLSNTFFFDKCLGWDGLCVEPLPQYHDDLRKHRSCTLIPECISDSEKYVNMGGENVVAFVDDANKAKGNTKCSTLDGMLKRSGDPFRRHADLWSLDVEGYEMTVLNSVDFTKIDIDAVIVEDYWINSRDLDLRLTNNGFAKFQQMAIDSLYTKRHLAHHAIPTELYYPPNWAKNIVMNVEYRKKADVIPKLKCY